MRIFYVIMIVSSFVVLHRSHVAIGQVDVGDAFAGYNSATGNLTFHNFDNIGGVVVNAFGDFTLSANAVNPIEDTITEFTDEYIAWAKIAMQGLTGSTYDTGNILPTNLSASDLSSIMVGVIVTGSGVTELTPLPICIDGGVCVEYIPPPEPVIDHTPPAATPEPVLPEPEPAVPEPAVPDVVELPGETGAPPASEPIDEDPVEEVRSGLRETVSVTLVDGSLVELRLLRFDEVRELWIDRFYTNNNFEVSDWTTSRRNLVYDSSVASVDAISHSTAFAYDGAISRDLALETYAGATSSAAVASGSAQPISAPEPSTILMAIIGIGVVWRRRASAR